MYVQNSDSMCATKRNQQNIIKWGFTHNLCVTAYMV